MRFSKRWLPLSLDYKAIQFVKLNKDELIAAYYDEFLNRCMNIFLYSNIPKSIEPRAFALSILYGCGGLFKDLGGEWRIAPVDLGGEIGANLRPDKAFIISDSTDRDITGLAGKEFTIDKDIWIIPFDSCFGGVLDICRRYSILMADAMITLDTNIITSRAPYILSATTKTEREEAESFLAKLWNGDIDIIGSSLVSNDGVKSIPFYQTTAQGLTQIVEAIQYIKSSFYHEIGLRSNYNMKRESLNSAETVIDEEAILSLVEDSFNTQKYWIDKLNKATGLEIEIELNRSLGSDEETEKLLEEAREEVKDGGSDMDSGYNADDTGMDSGNEPTGQHDDNQ